MEKGHGILMKITDSMIKKSCSATIYKRGMEYFREGRVHLRKREKNLINAVVDGDEIYNVQVRFSEEKVESCMCTCPYFQTMDSVCKHIVAVLKQRQTELEEGSSFVDENDHLAGILCTGYSAQKKEKTRLFPSFSIHISTSIQKGVVCSVSMDFESSGRLHGIENFFESYLEGREFKIDRKLVYNPSETEFAPAHKAVVDVLAESYESRSSESYYQKAAFQTSIGRQTLSRLFPLLENVDYSIIFDGINLGRVMIAEENPDILIDINASDEEIMMSVSDRGTALTRDGEWFMYENTIYHTDSEWQKYFMPIYNALAVESRTYITFRGANRIMFATDVLGHIRNKQGVVMQGLDEIIVDEKPSFDIYFDGHDRAVTAVVIAKYGNISLKIPDDEMSGGKIVVRDFESENEIIESFEKFSRKNGMYILDDDNDIYDFITLEIPILKTKASLFMSDRFKKITITDEVDITASASYDENVNLLEADFSSELSYEQICAVLQAVRLRKRFVRLDSGVFLDVINCREKEIFTLLENLDFTEEELRAGRKILPKYQALYLDSLQCVEKQEGFSRLIDSVHEIKGVYPEHLKDVLRGYQKDGTAWMKQLAVLGFGGILADDMGLGKTLQVIAFVMGEKPEKPVLIVTPSALLYNWLNEINRFTPEAKVLVTDGTKEERAEMIKRIEEYDFVITSYPLLRRDGSLYKEKHFAYCFIDEAQYIKNPKTMNARSVKNVSADVKFALTGTPIENSLTELWSIFDFVMHGYLYTVAQFKNRYENPLVKDGDASVSEILRSKIKPFVLRRMKIDVLSELPEKIENTMYADLVPEQKKLYGAYLAMAKDRTLALMESGGRDKMRILTLLMRLRQICCHPSLFDESYKKDSGKLNLLLDIVQNGIASGHRLLIFSQFTSMLKIIREELDSLGIDSFWLDGNTKSYERAELSERFNGGERSVFLISLKAGGTGLNLIGADMVVHYDPWWNPAAVDQASDRAYRIGQTRAVQVIRLASKGTIEEKILRLQESKRSLADDIIKVNKESFANLTNEEILSLFE